MTSIIDSVLKLHQAGNPNLFEAARQQDIAEVSKEKLGKYVHLASREKEKIAREPDVTKFTSLKDLATRKRKAKNRNNGNITAVNKLVGWAKVNAKEEVEQVDETSAGKAEDHINKSRKSIDTALAAKPGESGHKGAFNTVRKRFRGINLAKSKLEKQGHVVPERASQRHLSTEEVQIDELSVKTMDKYVEKSMKHATDMDDRQDESGRPFSKTHQRIMKNRDTGIDRAEHKISKRTGNPNRLHAATDTVKKHTENVEFSAAELAHFEAVAPSSTDTMTPGSKSRVPVRTSRGIGDTVPDRDVGVSEAMSKDEQRKLAAKASEGHTVKKIGAGERTMTDSEYYKNHHGDKGLATKAAAKADDDRPRAAAVDHKGRTWYKNKEGEVTGHD